MEQGGGRKPKVRLENEPFGWAENEELGAGGRQLRRARQGPGGQT